MIQILFSFVLLILLAVIVKTFLDGYNYKMATGKDGKTTIKIIVFCLVFTVLLGISGSVLKAKYEKGKTISIIPISDIYTVNSEEFQYLIVDNEGDTFTLSYYEVSDVIKGDDSFIIHTHYPNSSGLSKFLINGPEDKCTVVLKDFNIPIIDKLSKQ